MRESSEEHVDDDEMLLYHCVRSIRIARNLRAVGLSRLTEIVGNKSNTILYQYFFSLCAVREMPRDFFPIRLIEVHNCLCNDVCTKGEKSTKIAHNYTRVWIKRKKIRKIYHCNASFLILFVSPVFSSVPFVKYRHVCKRRQVHSDREKPVIIKNYYYAKIE